MRRVLRMLRSRRLALWMLLGISIWSAIGTFTGRPLPDTDPLGAVEGTPLEGVAGLLGLAEPFSSPVFLAVVGLLVLSTVMCSWERGTEARRRTSSYGSLTPGDIDRIRDRPHLRIPLDAHADAEESLRSAAEILRSMHLVVRSGPRVAEAHSASWRAYSSTVFHVALAALILVFALGGLTRAEGLIGIPVGDSRVDQAASYGLLDEAPFYSGHSGLTVAVSDLVVSHVVDDVNRGPAPVVTLYDAGEEVAAQRVFPNHPLRYRSLLIHMDDWGFVAEVVLRSTEGAVLDRQDYLFDFDETHPSGVAPVELVVESLTDGTTVPVRIELWPAEDPSAASEIQVFTGAQETPSTPGIGESLSLPGGTVMSIERVGEYARLMIADDWSIGPIYALFGIGLTALAGALLLPHRLVRMMVVSDGDVQGLNVWARRARADAVFMDRLGERLRTRLGRSLEGKGPDDV